MLDLFLRFISKHELFDKTDRILLAVSGGLDSVVLLDLFVNAGYSCGIAHCNFTLRGEESDIDEEFVVNLASEKRLPVYVQRFDTEDYARLKGISLQMAARKLRYDWFEETRSRYGYSYISLAHNKDDIVETFLINITRGTGIKGISGIKPKSGYIVRPLLFAGRHEIQDYADTCKLVYREDSSNATTKYARNKIRHNILPVFRQINPRFNETVIENIDRFYEAEQIYQEAVDSVKNRILVHNTDGSYGLIIDELARLRHIKTYLFEMLKPFGFNEDETDEIVMSLTSESGKQFFSSTDRLVKDRHMLLVTSLPEQINMLYYIEKDTKEITEPVNMKFSYFENYGSPDLDKGPETAFLDAGLLDFPLVLRKWRQGEYFRPLGMKDFKKLSDFFIDQKMSLVEKEQTWILDSGGRIAWIAGKRTDDRFRVTPATSVILKIELLSN